MRPYLWMRPGPQGPAVGRKPPTSKQSRGRFREDRRTDWPWHYPHSKEGKHVLRQVSPPHPEPHRAPQRPLGSGLRASPPQPAPRPQPGVGSEVLSGCRHPLPQWLRHPSFLPQPASALWDVLRVLSSPQATFLLRKGTQQPAWVFACGVLSKINTGSSCLQGRD